MTGNHSVTIIGMVIIYMLKQIETNFLLLCDNECLFLLTPKHVSFYMYNKLHILYKLYHGLITLFVI